MNQGLTCLVTIHGIGFQQSPLPDGTPGYADTLHERLSHYLDAYLLGDDPHRKRDRRGQNGPVYVASEWPPASPKIEEGLRRVGQWASRPERVVDTSDAPLTDGQGRIAHVALVYSRLHNTRRRHPGSTIDALAKTLFSLPRYGSFPELLRMAIVDARATMRRPAPEGRASSPSLRVREDAPTAVGPELLATLRQLEDDVTTYISRNDLRERVRGFIREALLRICSRDDVDSVIINAHSQGTVLAFDVLRQLPPFIAPKVRLIVTAGSPLRKYSALFNWGRDIGCLAEVGRWVNFWDQRDPVADPLAPPTWWRPGSRLLNEPHTIGLYRAVDPETGVVSSARIEDCEVDNVARVEASGLPAHKYWDNEAEFVKPLAELLAESVQGAR